MSHHFETTWNAQTKLLQPHTRWDFFHLSGVWAFPCAIASKSSNKKIWLLLDTGSHTRVSKCCLVLCSPRSGSAVIVDFLLIVMWFDCLSTQVITVHLLSLLPMSDHSWVPPSQHCCLPTGGGATGQMHTVVKKCSYNGVHLLHRVSNRCYEFPASSASKL